MNRLVATFLIMLMCVACGESQWFTVAEDDSVIISTAMAPHTQKEVDVPSAKRLLLHFETDASHELMAKYQFVRRQPVRLELRGGLESIATVKGAGTVWFTPTNGLIPLVLKNETDEKLRIVVFARKKADEP